MKNKQKNLWAYGLHACQAILNNPARKINKIILSKDRLSKIEYKSPQCYKKIKQLPYQVLTEKEINEIVNKNNKSINIQSIAVNADFLIQKSIKEIKSMDKVIILDEIVDVANIGAIMRTGIAFGCNNMIVSKAGCPGEVPGLLRSASGAFEKFNFIKVGSIKQTIINLKKSNNMYFVAMDGNANQTMNHWKNNIYPNIKNSPICIVMGSEEKGVSNAILSECDYIVKIPCSEEMTHINVSCAFSILSHSIWTD